MQGKGLTCQPQRIEIGQDTVKVMSRESTEQDINKADRIGDLLHWLSIIARNEFVIGIEKLDTRLLECMLGQEQMLDM